MRELVKCRNVVQLKSKLVEAALITEVEDDGETSLRFDQHAWNLGTFQQKNNMQKKQKTYNTQTKNAKPQQKNKKIFKKRLGKLFLLGTFFSARM